jgi:hypothetical protein
MTEYEVGYRAERGDVTIERRRYSRYTTEYVVYTTPEYFTTDIEFIREGWRQARSLAKILNRDYWLVVESEEGTIPTEIAIEGKPAIATFLCGVHELPPEQIAKRMNITRDTVLKYLARFDRNR